MIAYENREYAEGGSYHPDALTPKEAELSTKDNCKGIIALSRNALQIQKNMLRYFPQDIANAMMTRTMCYYLLKNY